MNRDYNIINGKFHHIILEGTAYEVGERQGEILRNDEEMRARVERTISSFSSQLGASKDGKPDLKKMGFQDFDELQSFFEDYCPGLNEEMKGFADSVGVEISEMPFYGATYNVPKNCSQVAVLSPATSDKHARATDCRAVKKQRLVAVKFYPELKHTAKEETRASTIWKT